MRLARHIVTKEEFFSDKVYIEITITYRILNIDAKKSILISAYFCSLFDVV